MNEVIQEAALEAAARSMAKVNGWDEWDGDPHRDYFRSLAKEALEAAAPHMLAEAWDEGVRAKSEYMWSDDIEPLTNPYR